MVGKEHILAVGDLHGCLNLLHKVLDDVVPRQPRGTRLIFLGDYVDRGTDAAGVVAELIRLKARRPETVLLMGNHERMMLNAVAGREVEMFLYNGGQETLRSYGLGDDDLDRLPPEHMEFLAGLPLMEQSEEFIFVHAGLKPGVAVDLQMEKDLLWIRREFMEAKHDFGKPVVFGHTPLPRPMLLPQMIGIDTGAVYGNCLTCIKLPERELFSLS